MAIGLRLLNDIRAILARVKAHRHYMSGDIRAMFHQILNGVAPHSPLWVPVLEKRGGRKTMSNVSEFVMVSHTFGAKGSPFVACRALQSLMERSTKLSPDEKRVVQEQFYMDDLILAVNDKDEMIELMGRVKEQLQPQFQPTKFWSDIELVSVLKGVRIQRNCWG